MNLGWTELLLLAIGLGGIALLVAVVIIVVKAVNKKN